jgi:hypothetical protein
MTSKFSQNRYWLRALYITSLDEIKSPMQRLPGDVYLWLKRPEREANHSVLSSFEVSITRRFTFMPHFDFLTRCLAQGKIDTLVLGFVKYIK